MKNNIIHSSSSNSQEEGELPYGDALDTIAANAAREVGGIFTDSIPIKSLVVYARAVAKKVIAAEFAPPQAAANKAAEEGGLPMTVREAFEDRHEGYEFPSEALKSGAFGEYMAGWRAADRASRQVANKAEVDLSSLFRSDWSELGMLPASEGTYVDFEHVEALLGTTPTNKAEVEPACVCGSPTTLGSVHRADGPCYVAEATPPATTGASTARDQALEEAAALVEGCDKRASLRGISIAIRALKAKVGASTVLTDERSQFEAYVRNECDSEEYADSILGTNSGGFYHAVRIQGAWEGWQARSKVAAQDFPAALADECIVRKPTHAVQAPAGFDERESLIWNMGRSSVEQLAIEPVTFMYQDDQDLAEPGTGSCVVSKARCNLYRNETPLYAVNLAAQAAKELTESELSQIILKRTNPIAAEKYGDTFLRIAQAVQREVLARIGQHVAREVAAQAGQVAVPEGWKLVPQEPTDSMRYAYERDAVSGRVDIQGYKAMISAAPSPAKESK